MSKKAPCKFSDLFAPGGPWGDDARLVEPDLKSERGLRKFSARALLIHAQQVEGTPLGVDSHNGTAVAYRVHVDGKRIGVGFLPGWGRADRKPNVADEIVRLVGASLEVK